MSEVKQNHYVPRFHLKNFTDKPNSDKNDGRFDFYNIKAKKSIGNIPFKEQMREKYFYKKGSVIDTKLNIEFETKHARIVKNPITNNVTENDLLEICLLMLFRTKAQRDYDLLSRKFFIDQNIDYLESSFKSYLKENVHNAEKIISDLDLKELVREESYKEYLSETSSAEKNIEKFERFNKEVEGLRSCILKNDTGINLISSDVPVIKSNPFLQKRVKNVGIDGMYQMGVLLLLPISPEYLVVSYDPEIYNDPRLFGISQSDIIELNRRQLMQGNEGVYSTSLPKDIIDNATEILENKPVPKMIKVSLPNDYEYYYTDEQTPVLSLSFITQIAGVENKELIIPFKRQ